MPDPQGGTLGRATPPTPGLAGSARCLGKREGSERNKAVQGSDPRDFLPAPPPSSGLRAGPPGSPCWLRRGRTRDAAEPGGGRGGRTAHAPGAAPGPAPRPRRHVTSASPAGCARRQAGFAHAQSAPTAVEPMASERLPNRPACLLVASGAAEGEARAERGRREPGGPGAPRGRARQTHRLRPEARPPSGSATA